MTEISPWFLLLAAPLILFMGQWIVRWPTLAQLRIPGAVVGGLIVALVMLTLNLTSYGETILLTKVASPAWTWASSSEARWPNVDPQDIHFPIMIGFFTCVGLSASWKVIRSGGRPLLIFLALATCFGIVQNLAGIAIAKTMNASPYLGLLCGGLSLTGGLGTIFGFGPIIENAGFIGARAIDAAAATFGLVTGGLLSGPVGGWLIVRHRLENEVKETDLPPETTLVHESAGSGLPLPSLLTEVQAIVRSRRPSIRHIVIIVICMKLGAWISFALGVAGLTFPAQIGAMIAGIVIRNVDAAFGSRVIVPAILRVLMTLLLGLFLVMAMSSLNLLQIAGHGKPMIVILTVQVALMVFFAALVTFTIMGRRYAAALFAAGHIGFGLGITPNAISSMDLLARRYGPAPQAVLVVTVVGAFLIDLTNSLVATLFLNLMA